MTELYWCNNALQNFSMSYRQNLIGNDSQGAPVSQDVRSNSFFAEDKIRLVAPQWTLIEKKAS